MYALIAVCTVTSHKRRYVFQITQKCRTGVNIFLTFHLRPHAQMKGSSFTASGTKEPRPPPQWNLSVGDFIHQSPSHILSFLKQMIDYEISNWMIRNCGILRGAMEKKKKKSPLCDFTFLLEWENLPLDDCNFLFIYSLVDIKVAFRWPFGNIDQTAGLVVSSHPWYWQSSFSLFLHLRIRR